MEIYILRHAIAVPRGTPGYPNDDRPLTQEGVEKMTEAAAGIAMLVDKFDVIISSPLIRALDTSRITAEAAGNKDKVITCEYLIPGSPKNRLYDTISKYSHCKKILLVGHEPHLGYLASGLIGIGESVIDLKKGGICRIDVEQFPPHTPGKLIWSLTPKQLRTIAGIK